MSSIKRVFLIGIDSVVYNRTIMGGYPLAVCPTLKKLADEGINCANNYSHSGPTQFSLPSVFTSTYPLDYNGYDKGITDRPNSLVEVLNREGFRTFGVLPNVWTSEFGGYERGFESTTDGYDLDSVWASASIYINYFDERLSDGYITVKERENLVLTHVNKLLTQTRVYCKKAIDESGKFNNDQKFKDIYRYDYTNILDLIPNDIETAQDAEGILDGLINLYSFPQQMKTLLHKNFASADWMLDSVLERLDDSPSPKTMSFAFLEDPHELNTCRGYGLYVCMHANKLLSSIPSSDRYRRIYKYFNKSYRASSISILYDASLKYVDNSLDRFIQGLKARSMLDESLIVIFSDHGTSFSNSQGIHASFEEDYLKVPMIFWASDMESKNIDTLTSLIDLAPTVLDFLNIKKPGSYKGISVIDKSITSREYILHENAGRGPCDILNKNLSVGLRDKNFALWTVDSDGIKDAHKKIITDRVADVKKSAEEFNS